MENVIVIAIAGASGSGKTTLANELKHRFSDQIILLSHDSYYKRHDDIPMEERAKLNYDHPDALETDLLVSHISALKSGQPIDCPEYDFTIHNRTDRVTRIFPKQVILVEGILVLEHEMLRNLFDVKVFVDTPAEICLARRVKRDVTERGRSVESVLSQFENTVWPMYKQFVEPSKSHANMIVPGGGKDKAVQDILAAYIQMHMGEGQI